MTPEPTPTRTRGPVLPWVLVALLSGLVIFLTAMLGVRTNELNAAPQPQATVTVTADAPTSTAPEPSATQPPTIEAQPTTGDRADQVRALLRNDPDDPLAKGSMDAPVTIIEWADYRCPFCAVWSQRTLTEIEPLITAGKVRIEFHDMSIFGEESDRAAVAARAAGAQGKYWDFAHEIWALHTGQGHPPVNEATVIEIATRIGVADLNQFRSDLADPTILADVQAATRKAQQLGIQGTPFFFVNSTPVSGALPTETFLDLLAQYGVKR